MQHSCVRGQCLGDERADPVTGRDSGEVLEQQHADAATLVLVADKEGHFGRSRVVEALVCRNADDFAADLGYKGVVLVVRCSRQSFDVLTRGRGRDREEPQVERVWRQLRVHGAKRIGICLVR